MKKLLLAFAILTIAFSSCKKEEKEEPLKPLSEAILGTWNVPNRVTDAKSKYLGVDLLIKEEVTNSKIKATFKADGTSSMEGEYQRKRTVTILGSSQSETTDETELTSGNFTVLSNTEIKMVGSGSLAGQELLFKVLERTNSRVVLTAEGEQEVDGEIATFTINITLTK